MVSLGQNELTKASCTSNEARHTFSALFIQFLIYHGAIYSTSGFIMCHTEWKKRNLKNDIATKFIVSKYCVSNCQSSCLFLFVSIIVCVITVTSPKRHGISKSLATQLFVQQLVYEKNIKAPHYCSFVRGTTSDCSFSTQRSGNANVCREHFHVMTFYHPGNGTDSLKRKCCHVMTFPFQSQFVHTLSVASVGWCEYHWLHQHVGTSTKGHFTDDICNSNFQIRNCCLFI